MKKSLSLCIITLCIFLTGAPSYSRIFFVGSNPYMSFIAYPQDILKFQGDFIIIKPVYGQLPWWGDVDQPANKPNDTYTSTDESIDNAGTSFSQTGRIHTTGTRVGLSGKFGNGISLVTTLDLGSDFMSNHASGSLSNTNTSFDLDYQSLNIIGTGYLQPIIAFTAGIPIGVKLGGGVSNSASLSHDLSLTNTTGTHTYKRMGWGWSTRHCANFFDQPTGLSLQGDAFQQDEYARGPVYQFDLQGGATFPKLRTGLRLRLVTGSQKQYAWQGDTTGSWPDNIFAGDYVESPWLKKTTERIIRLYGNYTWNKSERHAFNTLIFLGYSFMRAGNALENNQNIQSDSRDLARNLVVEFNPNINLNFGHPFFYIDAALLIEYSYSRMENRYDRWVNGGTTDSYRGSSVYVGDEYSWESFSYANENFGDLGFDMSIMLPIFGNAQSSLGLGLITFLNSKFTWQNKYYGDYPSSSTEFGIANIRKNFKREIWFNSMVILHYRMAPWQVRLELTEPLLYSLSPQTTITDPTGATELYSHSKGGPFASQQGIKIGLEIIKELGEGYFSGLFRRPKE